MTNSLRSKLRVGLTAVTLIALAGQTSAFAQNAVKSDDSVPETVAERRVDVGVLKCDVLPNTRRNYVVRSTAEVDCTFKPRKGEEQKYHGTAGIQLGLDLSVRESDTLRFAVLSSHKDGVAHTQNLAGKYFGVSATASVSYGVGVAALVGGSKKQISLQPLGIETLRGLGVSAGLGYMYLEPAK